MVKHVWNVAVHVLHQNCFIVINTTIYHSSQYETSSPSAKEIHGLTISPNR